MKNHISRVSEWIRKLDRLIEKRIGEILDLHTGKSGKKDTNQQNSVQQTTTTTEK